MLGQLSQRLLPALQLTRMALVFTAISNAQCTLMLAAQNQAMRHAAIDGSAILPFWNYLDVSIVAAIVIVSAGLYGFGMSLNDIIDRRRDRQLAAYRPLPSGRISLAAAYVICILLGSAAVLAGAFYARVAPDGGWLSLLVLLWTGLLIVFYDFAGKYLVAPGLLALGMIRFFQAAVPAPHLPVLWHPLWLLNHVTILSAIAYVWEEKRPALTRLHVWGVIGGLGFVDLLAVGVAIWRQHAIGPTPWLSGQLLWPAGTTAAFLLVAWRIRARSATVRGAGGSLMMVGLLWLIVYDAAFAAAYIRPERRANWLAAGILLALLPVAYIAVVVMRWWSKLLLLSQAPEYRRVR